MTFADGATSLTSVTIAKNTLKELKVEQINVDKIIIDPTPPVSYTHLDVYKRQPHVRWPHVTFWKRSLIRLLRKITSKMKRKFPIS